MFLDCNNPKLTPHERELCRKMAAKAARENADKTATELYAARDPRCLPDLHHHCGSGRPVMPPGVYAPERYARGEAHGLAKLDEKQVAAIRRSDDSYANLARKFGWAQQAISSTSGIARLGDM